MKTLLSKKGQEVIRGKFYDYLLKLGLSRMTIRSDKNSVWSELMMNETPNDSDFTEVTIGDLGQPIVKLAVKDFDNEAITKGKF